MLNSKLLGGTAAGKTYIEDVFSTWLYTGNGSTQTITNGIDLSGKGGLTWIKGRAASTHRLIDTVRGATKRLETNATTAEATDSSGLTAFNSDGFTLGSGGDYNDITKSFASWTFRKAAKFFDVVTYTGTGSARTVAHNLGSVPGCIIVKRTDTTGSWGVRHRSLADGQGLYLDLTNAASTAAGLWTTTPPTSTEFSLGAAGDVNASGGTYVAYLFAHDTGTDGLIQCGSYTGNGSTTGPTVSLGWEPQWLLIKRADAAGENWFLVDSMRGLTVAGSDDEYLLANSSNAAFSTSFIAPLATGFQLNSTSGAFNASGGTYIYIAIRRGPMRTPTDATKVFESVAFTGGTTNKAPVNTNNVVAPDLALSQPRGSSNRAMWRTRLTANGKSFFYTDTGAEADYSAYTDGFSYLQKGIDAANSGSYFNTSSVAYWFFRRAPGFFDAVAYTGTGSATTISHNLGVAPELMIVKRRNAVASWLVYSLTLGATKYLSLNTTAAEDIFSSAWNNTAPTASVFSVGDAAGSNASGGTYIAYLFATLPGISKVGTYTGSGTTKQIDCGFTAGARFVLIKRTDSTGDWFVWDTARGIVSGNDPYLLLNSTAAEVTSTDYIDPLNSGFEISSTAPAAINANGGTFIYLAIA